MSLGSFGNNNNGLVCYSVDKDENPVKVPIEHSLNPEHQRWTVSPGFVYNIRLFDKILESTVVRLTDLGKMSSKVQFTLVFVYNIDLCISKRGNKLWVSI